MPRRNPFVHGSWVCGKTLHAELVFPGMSFLLNKVELPGSKTTPAALVLIVFRFTAYLTLSYLKKKKQGFFYRNNMFSSLLVSLQWTCCETIMQHSVCGECLHSVNLMAKILWVKSRFFFRCDFFSPIEHIQKIMTLEESVQHVVMTAIQEVSYVWFK